MCTMKNLFFLQHPFSRYISVSITKERIFIIRLAIAVRSVLRGTIARVSDQYVVPKTLEKFYFTEHYSHNH